MSLSNNSSCKTSEYLFQSITFSSQYRLFFGYFSTYLHAWWSFFFLFTFLDVKYFFVSVSLFVIVIVNFYLDMILDAQKTCSVTKEKSCLALTHFLLTYYEITVQLSKFKL